MTVAVWIVALAEDLEILLITELGAVQAMARGRDDESEGLSFDQV